MLPWALHRPRMCDEGSWWGPAYCSDMTIMTTFFSHKSTSQFTVHVSCFHLTLTSPLGGRDYSFTSQMRKTPGPRHPRLSKATVVDLASTATWCLPSSPAFGHSSCSSTGLWTSPPDALGFGSLNYTKVAGMCPSPRSLLALLHFEFGFTQENEKWWDSVGFGWPKGQDLTLVKTALQKAQRLSRAGRNQGRLCCLSSDS